MEEQKGAVRFFGIDQQYFLGAVFPLGSLDGRCAMAARGDRAHGGSRTSRCS